MGFDGEWKNQAVSLKGSMKLSTDPNTRFGVVCVGAEVGDACLELGLEFGRRRCHVRFSGEALETIRIEPINRV